MAIVATPADGKACEVCDAVIQWMMAVGRDSSLVQTAASISPSGAVYADC